jgi:K+-transporting ATPase ATPase C chain
MATHLYRSVVLVAIALLVCGGLYNVAGWALTQAAFHSQANGSVDGNGSTLIGQPWSVRTTCSTVINGTTYSSVPTIPRIDPMWFQGRPDCDNPLELNGTAGSSGAANLGPKSSVLVSVVQQLVKAWHRVGVNPTGDLVTSSGSGIDPDISQQDALVQIPMVAKARHLSPALLRSLVYSHTAGAQYGFLGAPYVNVLALNEALAQLAGTASAR